MNTPSFEPRLFWILFAVCITPPLVAFVALLFGPDYDDIAFTVAFFAAGTSLIVYAVLFVASLVYLVSSDRARGLTILAALLAGIIVGPGVCFGLGPLL